MPLYPSLEDMKVDHMAQAQVSHEHRQQPQQPTIAASATPVYPSAGTGSMPQQPGIAASAPPVYPSAGTGSMGSSQLYPSIGEFMGLEISHATVSAHMPEEVGKQVLEYKPPSHGMVAPITGEQNMGLMRAEVRQGVRQLVACKDGDGKLGIRVQHVNKGVFVALVTKGSPAALAGLRFGDQVLQINGTTVAGYDRDKVMNLIKKAPSNRIELAIRDRPFERTITLQKDSTGHVGFIFKNGKITSIVTESSAARNGLLIDHTILEVNGQNVVGLKDKEISDILTASDRSMTLTIIPTFIYDHMVKCMKSSLVRKEMDHSIPDL